MKNIVITIILVIVIGVVIDIILINRKILKDVSWVDIIKNIFKK